MNQAPDDRATRIADEAERGTAPSLEEIEYLLQFDAESDEATYICNTAHEIGMRACGGRGYVYAQIGVDCTPCAKNCRFCSFAAVNAVRRGEVGKRQDWETPLDEIVHFARLFSDEGVHLVSLMATAQLDFGRYLEIVRAARACVRDEVIVMANTGDITLEQAHELRKAGATAAYHALRLGEGELTGIDPAERRRAIGNLHAAGLQLMTGVEPVWAEVDRTELAARICDTPAFRPFCTGACALHLIGDESGDCPPTHPVYTPPSAGFLRYVAALTRLACGTEVPVGGIGGVRWVDAGCDPRERHYGSADDHLRRQVARAVEELKGAGFVVEDT